MNTEHLFAILAASAKELKASLPPQVESGQLSYADTLLLAKLEAYGQERKSIRELLTSLILKAMAREKKLTGRAVGPRIYSDREAIEMLPTMQCAKCGKTRSQVAFLLCARTSCVPRTMFSATCVFCSKWPQKGHLEHALEAGEIP